MRLTALLPIFALPILLAGCGADIEKDAAYANTIQLRTALTGAGHECPGQHQIDKGSDAEDIKFSLKCDDEVMLETVSEEFADKLDEEINSLHALTDLSNTLHGPNWIITSGNMTRLASIQEDLGGKITAGD